MTEERAITHVRQRNLGGTAAWQVFAVREDGKNHVTCFPDSALEQRIAEYDLDPTDIDGVLDIIMHEVHVEEPTETKQTFASKTDMPDENAGIPAIYTAESVAEARDAMLARIADVKANKVIHTPHKVEQMAVGFALVRSTGPDDDPLEVLRQNHGVTPEGVERRKAEVDQFRRGILGLPQEPIPRFPEPPHDEAGAARRVEAMVEDPGNPEITVAPGWVTLALSRE